MFRLPFFCLIPVNREREGQIKVQIKIHKFALLGILTSKLPCGCYGNNQRHQHHWHHDGSQVTALTLLTAHLAERIQQHFRFTFAGDVTPLYLWTLKLHLTGREHQSKLTGTQPQGQQRMLANSCVHVLRMQRRERLKHTVNDRKSYKSKTLYMNF